MKPEGNLVAELRKLPFAGAAHASVIVDDGIVLTGGGAQAALSAQESVAGLLHVTHGEYIAAKLHARQAAGLGAP